MNCRRVRKLISAELDGSLDANLGKTLQTHLGQCDACRAFRQDLVAAIEALEAMPAPPEPRPGFAGRTLARLPVNERSRLSIWLDRWSEVIQPAPTALGAAALALGVMLAISMNGHSTSAVAAESTDETEQLFALSFDLTPTDSIGGRYLALLDEGED